MSCAERERERERESVFVKYIQEERGFGIVGSRQGMHSWMSAAAATPAPRVDLEGKVPSMQQSRGAKAVPDADLGFGERAFAAAGAAFISAILVNPLDVAKTRLQAQAAGVPYQGLCHTVSNDPKKMLPDLRSSPSCIRAVLGSEPVCPPECSQSHYKGTVDVFHKIIHQEGVARLWRGTTASLALAMPTVGIYLPCYDILRNLMEEFTTQHVPNLTPYAPLVAGSVARSLACIACYPVELARTRMQAFKVARTDTTLSGVRKTLLEVINPIKGSNILQNLKSYRILWTGLGAQLARDVPFSAICWATLEPIRRELLDRVGDGAGLGSIMWTNFSAGFVAGSLAAAATCPLDVAKTRRQIENDPARALKMTTKQTLLEIWRDGRTKGLFTGIGPRIGRAGPSVGIVVSFYEVVKYFLHRRRRTNDRKE